VIDDETCPNNVSSTRLRYPPLSASSTHSLPAFRTAIRRGESIKYCTEDAVIDYINAHGLYQLPPLNDPSRDPAISPRAPVDQSVSCDDAVLPSV
jgi:hypothetical protein